MAEGRPGSLARQSYRSPTVPTPEAGTERTWPRPCAQRPGQHSPGRGVRLSLGVPSIQRLSPLGTGTGCVTAICKKQDGGTAAPQGSKTRGRGPASTFSSCTWREKYSRHWPTPWGASLGFAKFSRGEEAIPDPAPMNEPANSLLFLPPGDFNV